MPLHTFLCRYTVCISVLLSYSPERTLMPELTIFHRDCQSLGLHPISSISGVATLGYALSGDSLYYMAYDPESDKPYALVEKGTDLTVARSFVTWLVYLGKLENHYRSEDHLMMLNEGFIPSATHTAYYTRDENDYLAVYLNDSVKIFELRVKSNRAFIKQFTQFESLEDEYPLFNMLCKKLNHFGRTIFYYLNDYEVCVTADKHISLYDLHSGDWLATFNKLDFCMAFMNHDPRRNTYLE